MSASPSKSPRSQAAKGAGPEKRARGFQNDRTVGEETWLTPRWLVDALDLPRIAAVDPCAPPVRFWKTAKRHYDKAQDGFNRTWKTTDFHWVNPPYGRECRQWMDKLANHGNGLLLIFARTDTAAFHDSVLSHPNAHAIFFFRGRLRFANAAGEESGPAGAPSALVAYGQQAVEVIERAIDSDALDGHLMVFSR